MYAVDDEDCVAAYRIFAHTRARITAASTHAGPGQRATAPQGARSSPSGRDHREREDTGDNSAAVRFPLERRT